jgi:protein-ribulosamine 3-kinase
VRQTRALLTALEQALRTSVSAEAHVVHGGSINDAFRFETGVAPVFVKVAAHDHLEMFAAESAGLEALADAHAVRVPKVLALGESDDRVFLALEWIELVSSSEASEALLGEQLAAQHRSTQRQFGWHRDNTIGSTPQPNPWTNDWVHFLREHRLGFQLELASTNGAGVRFVERGRQLCESIEGFFSSYRPVPSLLHGDLWSGNRGTDMRGRPVIFDPAVYYGDREADVAMTRLFGGFDPAFYAAYQNAWPLDQGVSTRSELYTLYHVLNHFNLFGGGYLAQAQRMIDRLLAELGH